MLVNLIKIGVLVKFKLAILIEKRKIVLHTIGCIYTYQGRGCIGRVLGQTLTATTPSCKQ